MWKLILATMAGIVLTSAPAEAACICPLFNMGPHPSGGFMYYSMRYDTPCAGGQPVGYLGGANAEASCIAPSDCSNCVPLGDGRGEGGVAAVDRRTGAAKPFMTVDVPVAESYLHDPNAATLASGETLERRGIAVPFGPPSYLKVKAKTGDKFVKVFYYQYLAKYPGMGGETSSSLVGLAFECPEPTHGEATPLCLGGLTRAEAIKASGDMEAIPNVLSMNCGVATLFVRVKDADEWVD